MLLNVRLAGTKQKGVHERNRSKFQIVAQVASIIEATQVPVTVFLWVAIIFSIQDIQGLKSAVKVFVRSEKNGNLMTLSERRTFFCFRIGGLLWTTKLYVNIAKKEKQSHGL